MKNIILTVVVAAAVAIPCSRAMAAEQTDAAAQQPGVAAKPDAATEQLHALVAKVNAKIKEGKKTEADMADEIKEFDKLLAEHKGEKTDAAGQLLFMKAMLYVQVFDDSEAGAKLLQQLKSDYPETKAGKNVDHVLAMIKEQAEAKKIQAALVRGAKFPDFEEKDVEGKPLSIGRYKGKVVLVDFWATWCGPCVGELPNVLKTYKAHHDKGFEIVGISLDEDRDKLTTFVKQKNMTWQQFFDGKGWSNKLAEKYGVKSIPATYLLDGEGNIIAANLRGPALEEAVTKALSKE